MMKEQLAVIGVFWKTMINLQQSIRYVPGKNGNKMYWYGQIAFERKRLFYLFQV